jgi:hypothetical protein
MSSILKFIDNSEDDGESSTKKVRQEGLDKFYTIPSVVDKCLQSLLELYEWDEFDSIIEPSAGNGNFLIKLPESKRIGIDIKPEHNEIIEQDFFDFRPGGSENDDKILVIGNPPFGRVSSLAIKFFNHASRWASVIAFIIPRTFRRISVQNKLDTNFHLVFDEDIPTSPCSFSPPMMVKCCFQIWEKRESRREIIKLPTSHSDWKFLGFGPIDENGQPTPPEGADFAIRAYGGKCGEIREENLESLRPKSWHWIVANIDKNILKERFANLDYSNSQNTARQNSIGRSELVSLYTSYIEQL